MEFDVLIGTAGDLITRIVLRFEECHIGNSIIGLAQIRAAGGQLPGGSRALANSGPREAQKALHPAQKRPENGPRPGRGGQRGGARPVFGGLGGHNTPWAARKSGPRALPGGRRATGPRKLGGPRIPGRAQPPVPQAVRYNSF